MYDKKQDQVLQPEDIQGLTLLGYNHLGYGAYLFFTIKNNKGAKSWLTKLLEANTISNAGKWDNGKPSEAVNVAFTFNGVHALLGASARVAHFPQEFEEGMAFRERSKSVLGDTEESDPNNWEFGGTKPDGTANREDIHGMVVILADSLANRDTLVEQYTADMQSRNMQIVYTQTAEKLPHDREHFGFHDGSSQPHVEGSHRPKKLGDPTIEAGEFILGYRNEYEQFPDLPTLNRDYRLGRNGTYVVVRKLHQDVAGFWNLVADYAEQDNAVPPEGISKEEKMIWLASKFVGRWPNGTPLVYSPDKQIETSEEELNNFYYAGGKEGKNPRDPHGLKCPFSSHTRRMNPRDSLGPTTEDSLIVANRHMIIRRGMPYGKSLFEDILKLPTSKVEPDSEDRGLMFLCLNANISRQFEFIQQTWANNTKFHGHYQDRDPLIGNQYLSDHSEITSSFIIPRQPVRQRILNIPRFVNVKGGGYFFMPSLTALNLMINHVQG